MSIMEFTVENALKIYFYIASFATILFVLKLAIFSFVGGDSEVHADFTAETDSDISFNFLSIQSILAFLMGFGWMGYTCIRQIGIDTHIKTLLISFSVGVVFMCLNTFLMFLVRKLEKNVKVDKSTALNTVGKAYTSIAPKACGQIEIEVSGKLSIENAMNATEEQINSFEPVKVVNVIDGLFYGEKVK
ncbi:MAG: hypothetical protein NC191_09795 [Muribaculaceae bacterium]|nr:hypothetical protein [Muribaculaceae bacterium]